jgi:transcriptional regulator with XRE-family HTH domain
VAKKGLDLDKPLAYNGMVTPSDLKHWRSDNALSQSQLAEALGVHIITISKWERGVRKIPPFLYLALKYLEQEGVTKSTKGKRKNKEKGE